MTRLKTRQEIHKVWINTNLKNACVIKLKRHLKPILKFIQYFNKENSRHGMWNCKRLTKSKVHVKNVNIVKSPTSKNRMLRTIKHSKDWVQNIKKQIDYKKTMHTKQIQYKIFESKNGNTKLSSVQKYK